jgi:hypothetical protein
VWGYTSAFAVPCEEEEKKNYLKFMMAENEKRYMAAAEGPYHHLGPAAVLG